ncbi:hypothetical protein [Streptomyces griseofuscus]|uniref:hypothetical protein n=1 Tax=Streptomyces griseofuscus TaxID=146922 RepID=UPI00382AB136
MTTTPRSPRLLLASTVLLTVAGGALLDMPQAQPPPAPAVSPRASRAATSATSPSAPTASSSLAGGTDSSASPSAPTQSAPESALPPHGEGVAGDQTVQRSLETAWPPDLPAADERELRTEGRALLRADATGVGRGQWPDVFPDSNQVAPAFATARFRVQAAIARRDGSPAKAVVHLVWAGMDRGGTFTDLRVSEWHFTRTFEKGAATWTPQPRL